MSSAIPFFAPPEWAWQLLDLATGKITPLTTATARQLDFPIDAAATAQFTMPGSLDQFGNPAPETALVKELATDVLVSRNGRPVFRGRVGTSAETHANDTDTVQFTAVDYRGLLDHRIIWPGSQLTFNATFPPNDESAIAWQMITDSQAQAGGDLGITEGTGIGTTGVLRDRTYTAGVPLGQTLDELANLENGFEWEVDTNLAFNVFYPQRPAQAASQVLALGRGLTAITSTVNTDAYANAVYYTGHQPETMPVEELLGIFPPGVGRWESQVTDPNVTLQATVEEQGQAALLTASQLDPAFTLTMSPAWWEPGDIWLGDVVRVQVRDGRLDVDVARRVVNIAITLDDDGTETVVLTANVPTPASATRSALAPPPNPGGAGKVSKFSQRIHSLDHRVSKLELVAAQGAGDLPYFSGSKGPSTALDNAGTAILTTADVPTGRYLVTITATFSFSAADTMHLAFQGDTGAFFGAPLTITHTAVGNFGEVYSSTATYVMTVTSEGAFQLWGYQLNATSDVTVYGNFISAGGAAVTAYTMVKIGNYP